MNEPHGTASASLLDDVVRDRPEPSPDTDRSASPHPGTSLVAVCVDDRHPDLVGRVKVAWRPSPESDEVERWVPSLQTTVVRTGDRVLLLQPGNGEEPVVVGVVDGFARRAEPEPTRRPTVELPDDEALRVVDRAGRPLVEIRTGPDGAELRLVDENVALKVGGRFRIEAGAIEMRAVEGGVDVEASDDVQIRGEVVKLN
ncbi:hypothetical protein WI460_15870 [Gemmatimonadota bacterium Y43]|uniref:hypothetical protein n=1 Tax=Gaopeijia maritima TaxID=3119007 RepID=UPI0032924F44